MENRWPYFLVFALLIIAFPGPLMSVWDRLTKHRITPEEAVRMAYGEEAVFIPSGELHPPYDDELRRLGVFSHSIYCGEVRAPGRWFAAAVSVPLHRRTDQDPIVYSVWSPQGFNTRTWSNPLPGRELLKRCETAD